MALEWIADEDAVVDFLRPVFGTIRESIYNNVEKVKDDKELNLACFMIDIGFMFPATVRHLFDSQPKVF